MPTTDVNHANHDAAAQHTPRGGPALFPVTIPKFVLLSLVTGRLYLWYWMYRQWKAIRDYSGLDISPSWRGVTPIIWCVPLFKELRVWTNLAGVNTSMRAAVLAAIFLAFDVGCSLLAYMFDNMFLWFLSYLYVIPVAIIQKEVNAYICQVAPNADMNQRFSPWNVVVILIGVALFLLGMVVPGSGVLL